MADLPWPSDARPAWSSGAPMAWPGRDSSHLLVSSAQMAALEERLFASGLPVEALMEKAALAITAELHSSPWWRQLRQRGALVLVGPGHNGGDGLVVARELHLAGIAVRIWSPFERHKPLTAAHWRHARWLGIPTLEQLPDPADPAVWLDALFGIRQSRPLEEPVGALLQARSRQAAEGLIAIDVPSGLCADSGRPLGDGCARAALTCCIGLLKQGLVQDDALAWVGQLQRIDLGLPASLLATLPSRQPMLLLPDDQCNIPWPAAPPAAASKYARGRLLVVAGSDTYRGAASLCLQGASASGCGSLRAAVPEPMAAQLWQSLPHVVVSAGLGSHVAGALQLESLPASALERLDALVLGPGLGLEPDLEAEQGADQRSDRPPEAIWGVIQQLPALLLLDADGLNRLARMGDAAAWLRGRRGPTWITPHADEFQRLFPDLGGQPPLQAAAAAAACSGACVLLKGARSVIAAPDGRRWQLGWAHPAAARAGLGDVLAGYAAGRAAIALAAGVPADGGLLASAALDHAQAADQAVHANGSGGATPMAVAAALATGACNTTQTSATK